MVRLLPALLAVAMLLSVPAVSVAGPPAAGAVDAAPATASAGDSASPPAAVAAQQSPPPNTTNLLLLDDVQASNFTRPEADLATTLSMQGSELDGRLVETVFTQRLRALETTRAKRAFLFNVTAELRNEVDGLLAAEERARRLYNRGETNASEYVRELARLSRQAESLSPTIDEVSSAQSNAVPDLELRSRLGKLDADLAVFRGPILEAVGSVTRADSTPFDLYVQTSENGMVLSTMDGSEYVREAYRVDMVQPDAPRITLAAAEVQMGQLYPWLRSLSTLVRSPQVTGLKNGVWWFRDQHPHGRLSTYFYANTTAPYREVQFKSLSGYPFESSETTISPDVVLTVNRTYVGGPMAVKLTNETGAPLDGEIRVNGSSVGLTGSDGTLWVLQPGGSVTVSAVHEGEVVEMDLEAEPAVDAGGG